MPETPRQYFDRKVPLIVEPGEGGLGGPRIRTWMDAWGPLSRQMFVVLPQQLDRCKVNRNKFLSAVK